MLQFCLASKNLQEQYSNTLYTLFSSYIQRTAASALLEALVSSLASFSRLKIQRNRGNIKASFNTKNAVSCLGPYKNLRVFFVISKSSKVIFKQSLINILRKLVNLIKNCTSLTLVGQGQFQISANFFKLTLILSLKIINSRYLVRIVQNLLLS